MTKGEIEKHDQKRRGRAWGVKWFKSSGKKKAESFAILEKQGQREVRGTITRSWIRWVNGNSTIPWRSETSFQRGRGDLVSSRKFRRGAWGQWVGSVWGRCGRRGNAKNLPLYRGHKNQKTVFVDCGPLHRVGEKRKPTNPRGKNRKEKRRKTGALGLVRPTPKGVHGGNYSGSKYGEKKSS